VYGPHLCGSGALVRDRLVLTAAHVVGEVGSEAWVRFLDARDRVGCRVVHRSASADAALLQIVDPGTPAAGQPPVPPTPWGALVCTRPGIRCEAVGFPQVNVGDDNVREVEHLTGAINPLTGAKGRRLDIAVDSPPAPTTHSQQSPWAGFSGAPVFCGDHIVGVVTKDTRGFDSRRLTAVPVAEFAAEVAHLIWPDAASDRAGLEPVELVPLQALRPEPVSPASLLRADAEVVPFRYPGRDELLDTLGAWCAADEPLSAALIEGQGGQGKTRLARQLGYDLRDDGWVTVHLASHPAAEAYEALASADVRVLIIVDYAEQRRAQMTALAQALAGRDRQLPPVRVLMLARADGEWRTTAPEEIAFIRAARVPVVSLPVLHPDLSERNEAFVEAVDAYAVRLGSITGHRNIDWADAARRVVPADLTGQPTALAVQAHALVTLLQAGQPVDDPALVAGATVHDILNSHEAGYWAASAATYELNLAATTKRFAVAIAALLPATDVNQAIAVLARVPGLRDVDEDRRMKVAEWLGSLYPQRGLQWGALMPNLLAEHLVGDVMATCPTLLDDILPTATAAQAHHVLTVLARASVHQPHLKPVITRLIADGGPTLAAAAAAVATETPHHEPLTVGIDGFIARHADDPDTLAELREAFPAHSRVHADRAVDIAQRAVAGHRRHLPTQPWIRRLLRRRLKAEQVPAHAQLARSLSAMSTRLAVVGRWADALAAAEETVVVYRRLERADPDEYRPGLARALDVLSSRRAATGQRADALAAAEEAVRAHRHLVTVHRDGQEADLARSLIALADRHADLDHHAAALAACEQATEVYRRLANATPGRYDADLARCLDSLSSRVAAVTEGSEAVVAADFAVRVFRRLAGESPDTYEPDLARLLGTLSDRRAALGDLEDALVAANEAAEIFRRLVGRRPETYEPHLAESLERLSRRLADLHHLDDALAAITEAVEIYRRLPATHGCALARALETLSDGLAGLDKVKPALAAICEAVELYHKLAAGDPEAFGSALARSVESMSTRLDALHPLREALATVRDAVDVCRRLVETNRAAFEPRLARSLNKYSADLAFLDDEREALTAGQEAADIYRRLAAAHPESHDPDLAGCLDNLAARFTAVDRHDDAAAAAAEAVAVHRRLARRGFDRFGPDLAKALVGLSADLTNLGRRAEALPVTLEAVEVYRGLAKVNPERFARELAWALEYVAADYEALGRQRNAETATAEARDVVRRLARIDPGTDAHFFDRPPQQTETHEGADHHTTHDNTRRTTRISEEIKYLEPG
jgi:hypothetical protein